MKRLIRILICVIVAFSTVSLHGDATEIMEYDAESESVTLCVSVSDSEKVIVAPAESSSNKTAGTIAIRKLRIPETVTPLSIKMGIRFCVFRE